MILNWLGWVFIALAILTLAAGVWMFRTAPYIEYVDPVDEAYATLPAGRPVGYWPLGNDGAHDRLAVDDEWRAVAGAYLEHMWRQPVAEVDR